MADTAKPMGSSDQSQEQASVSRSDMHFFAHITELRRRLIYVSVVLFFGLILGLLVAQPVYNLLMSQEPASLIAMHTFSLWDGINMYMRIALVVALLLTLPMAAYQLWAFVKPGLQPHEQRSTLKYIPFVAIMFAAGLSFAYFVIFPLAFGFTRMIASNLNLVETYGITQYFSFMFQILIPLALLFELPIVIMFLTAIRILNPIKLRKMRRVAYFVLTIIATMITPPDIVSDILVAIPLIGLFELSLWLSGRVYRKQLAEDERRSGDAEEEAIPQKTRRLPD